MSTLSMTRVSSGATISSTTENNNQAAIEAVVNGGIEAANIADDAVTAAKINSDVPRADYGLKQHTDGTLMVDPSDTNPCLEASDGGIRVKVDDSSIERASGGLQVKTGGITSAMMASDAAALLTGDQTIAGVKTFSSSPIVPAPTTDLQASTKKYVDDTISTQLIEAIDKIYDYGTSTSAYTEKLNTNLKICFGRASFTSGSSVSITNLPFSSATSYRVIVCPVGGVEQTWPPVVAQNSGAQFTVGTISTGTTTFNWIAIGT